jgi:linoleoyl-CoA desaturase
VLHHTYTNIPGHDEDLDAGRIIDLPKNAKWHNFHRFQQYYSVFFYGLLTFNWAYNRFQADEKLLKRKLSYGEAKESKNFGQHYHPKVIYVSIWIAYYHHRNHMVES